MEVYICSGGLVTTSDAGQQLEETLMISCEIVPLIAGEIEYADDVF